MSLRCDHLNEAAQAALEFPEEERLRSLRQLRWITYPRAKQILTRLEDLLLYPPMHRMPCALVVGETNNGKTAIMHRFERLHPAADNPRRRRSIESSFAGSPASRFVDRTHRNLRSQYSVSKL